MFSWRDVKLGLSIEGMEPEEEWEQGDERNI